MTDYGQVTETILSPEVLVTFIVCAALASVVIWLIHKWQGRQREKVLSRQRLQQESTIGRLLDSVAVDKDKVISEYEQRLRERDDCIASLEVEVGRLRDRVTSSGFLGLFGGRQRDVIGALLLENEQLHELLAKKQEQLRDLLTDATTKLLDRIEEQAQESARAVRYKQALLSAFLQQEEARRLLDGMIASGRVTSSPMTREPEEAEAEE